MTTINGLALRELRAEDADAVIALVASAYAEYPGCVLDLPGVDADLPELAHRLRAAGGRGWVLTDDGTVVACVGLAPLRDQPDPHPAAERRAAPGSADEPDPHPAAERRAAPGSADDDPRDGGRRTRTELKRLYVAATHRRRGLGRALVALVEEHAVDDLGATTVELWSDTRFTDAHRLYEQCGYVRTGETRRLHDPSHTTEYRYVKHLAAG